MQIWGPFWNGFFQLTWFGLKDRERKILPKSTSNFEQKNGKKGVPLRGLNAMPFPQQLEV